MDAKEQVLAIFFVARRADLEAYIHPGDAIALQFPHAFQRCYRTPNRIENSQYRRAASDSDGGVFDPSGTQRELTIP